jgi:hypothetical protein
MFHIVFSLWAVVFALQNLLASTEQDCPRAKVRESGDIGSFLQTAHHKKVGSQEFVPIERRNIVYVKVPKTGSSTAAGISRRIGAHHNLTGVFSEGAWIAENGEPGVWSEHGCMIDSETDDGCEHDIGKPPSMTLINRLKMPTFLWTMLREPAARAMSSYYWHHVTQARLEPSTESKLEYLSALPPNFMFRYLRRSAQDSLKDVLRQYNLIGVTERFDESVVALAASLRIPLSDVLYISSKNSTAAMKDAFNHTMKGHPPMEGEPQAVKWFLGNEFRKKNAMDYQLYEHANSMLSETVKNERVGAAVASFRFTLREVQEACSPADVTTAYLGHLLKCYARDWGCNYECIDRKSNDFDHAECGWCM